jgi:hypothetical protein
MLPLSASAYGRIFEKSRVRCKSEANVESSEHAARRSTRFSLQIPVVVTSLDPTCDFREECKTVVVNAHGCGVIVHGRLKQGTAVMLELVSSGDAKEACVVMAISFEANSWLLGLQFNSPENLWQLKNPPQDWG